MIEHELCICEYVDDKPHNWLVLQETAVQIKQMDETIWEGQAHELCELIEHLRAKVARLKARHHDDQRLLGASNVTVQQLIDRRDSLQDDNARLQAEIERLPKARIDVSHLVTDPYDPYG